MDTIWKSNQNGLIVGCARSLGLLSLLLVYGVLGLEMTGEVVYDNTFGYRDSWYSSRNEFGDDVTLSGKARSISSFDVEYFGEFNATGAESARIRFYANDGPQLSPSTLLYESGRLPIYPGYNLASLRGLAISVSNNFTWSIVFEGLSGSYSNRAGLLIYDPPVLGSSYSDFWMKKEGVWGTYVLKNKNANFPVRIQADPDPSMEILSEQSLPDGSRKLVITGPNFSSGELWYSDDQTEWLLLREFNIVSDSVVLGDRTVPPGVPRSYRVVRSTVPRLQLSSKVVQDGETQHRVIRVSGAPGSTFTLETAIRMGDWLPLTTHVFCSGIEEITDPPGSSFATRFYRAVKGPEIPVVLGYPHLLANGAVEFLVSGSPGMDCLIQRSVDLQNWTTEATRAFSYMSKTFNFVSEAMLEPGPVYYRAVPIAP
ncbi:MAG TPA: hypothetical protein P5186_18710 [Candidatus Paceibacterota bacterium]|nr:hypothetical protein [Candidatus Paceibacterota bacterium]